MLKLFCKCMLLKSCFPAQIRSQRDSDPVPYLCLPDELLLLIFSFLPHKDLVSFSRVCWQFYRISMDESLCKGLNELFLHTVGQVQGGAYVDILLIFYFILLMIASFLVNGFVACLVLHFFP